MKRTLTLTFTVADDELVDNAVDVQSEFSPEVTEGEDSYLQGIYNDVMKALFAGVEKEGE